MELWIKSQDKEALIKVNMGIMYWKDTNNRDCIVNKDNATGFSIMGAYKSKERALEVLDEIQQVLLNNEDYDYIGTALVDYDNSNYIYEMPNE